MNYTLNIFTQNRKNMLNLLKGFTLEQVNKIPTGFNNNLVWNAGHSLFAQQFLMYVSSGVTPLIPFEEYAQKYGPGSKPESPCTQQEWDQLLGLLESTAAKAVTDFNAGIFQTYNMYASEYFGIKMVNIEEAIQFNTFHEAVHFGHMAAMKNGL